MNDNDDKDHDINDKTPNIVTLGNDDNIDKTNMASLYLHLSKALGGEAGVDPSDPSVQKSICSPLRELYGLLSTAYTLPICPTIKYRMWECRY
jgi:hypothetical protein